MKTLWTVSCRFSSGSDSIMWNSSSLVARTTSHRDLSRLSRPQRTSSSESKAQGFSKIDFHKRYNWTEVLNNSLSENVLSLTALLHMIFKKLEKFQPITFTGIIYEELTVPDVLQTRLHFDSYSHPLRGVLWCPFYKWDNQRSDANRDSILTNLNPNLMF